MADTTYSVRLDDQASKAAKRVERALRGVDNAADRSARAMNGADRAYRGVSREALRVARNELKMAKRLDMSTRAAVRNAAAMNRAALAKARAAKIDKKARREEARGRRGEAMARGAIALGAGALVVGAGVELLKVSGQAAVLEDTFNRIAGNKTEFKGLQSEIKKMGLDLEQGEKAALGLRAVFGKTTTLKLLQFFKATNLDPDQAKRAANALNQIASDTVFKAQDRNQFKDAVPGFSFKTTAESVAKQMKISVEKASKLLRDGKISPTVGIRALFEGTLKNLKIDDLDAQIKKLSDSTPARLARVNNSVTETKRALGSALESTAFLSGIESVTSAIEGISTAAGSETLGSVLKAAAVGVGILGTAFIGMGIFAAGAWVLALGPLGLVIAGVTALGVGLSLVFDWFKRINGIGILDSLGNFFEALNPFQEKESAPFSMFDSAGNFIDSNLAGMPDPGEGLDFSSQQVIAEQATEGMGGMSAAAIQHMADGAASGSSSRSSKASSFRMGDVSIQVDGSQDPKSTGEAVRDAFSVETMGVFFEKMLEGVGA